MDAENQPLTVAALRALIDDTPVRFAPEDIDEHGQLTAPATTEDV